MRPSPALLAFLLLATLAPRAAAAETVPPAPVVERTLRLEHRYLNLPVKTGAPKRAVVLEVEGAPVRRFDIELTAATPDLWVFVDVAEWRGREARLRVAAPRAEADAIVPGDTLVGAEPLYAEARRPQFHFSSRRGWLNDPNGLVHYRGEYHLFYQLHPYGWNAGSKHWGHAVSRDLLHWEERPIALHADAMGQMYSGSGVVDWRNTSGLQRGGEPPLVLIYTATGPPRVQALAYSNDRGATWTKYAGNPVLHELQPFNRDPKVIWHEPTRRWIMVLYAGHPQPGQKDTKGRPVVKDYIEFLGSPDLKRWTPLSRTEGFYECPDLFELPVPGAPGETRWVLHGGLCDYMIGRFDGTTFTPETPKLDGPRGSAFFAAQTFSDMPDGRRVQIGWARMTQAKARAIFGGAPFNQMMNIPTELSLVRTPEGLRLAWQPIRELATLRRTTRTLAAGPLAPGHDPLAGLGSETCELDLELDPGQARTVTLAVHGVALVYDAATRQLAHEDGPSAVPLVEGKLRLRALVDRGLLEVFVGDGTLYLPLPLRPANPRQPALRLTAEGGAARIVRLNVHELASIWPAATKRP